MENKNILLIIASVCLFFVVIIGASMFLFWPAGNADSNYTAAQNTLFNNNSNTIQYTADAVNIENEENLTGDENREQPDSDEMEMPEENESVGEKREEDSGLENNTGVQNLVNGYIEDENEIQLIEIPRNTLTTQKPSYEPDTNQTTTQTTNTTATTTTQINTQTKPPKEYWIQAASYKNLSSAEHMNATLRDIGIICTIQTKDISGETWYRLRIGPYGNYDEAEKFLIWIKTIDGLEGSLIWEVNN